MNGTKSLEEQKREKEVERRKRNAQTCSTMNPLHRYLRDTDDDNDDTDDGPSSFCNSPSNSVESSNHATDTSGSPTEDRKSSSSSGKSGKQHKVQKPVRDTAWKNQKRREQEVKRMEKKQKEEEERRKIQEQQEKERLEKLEKKAAQKKKDEEKRRIREQEEERRRQQEEVERLEKEKEKEEAEKEKLEKKKKMNQFNREKKKLLKKRQYEAKKEAKSQLEEEKVPEDPIPVDRGILEKLIQAKKQLDEDQKQRRQKDLAKMYKANNHDFQMIEEEFYKHLKPILEDIIDFDEVDTSTIRSRSTKIDMYFKENEAFKADIINQLHRPQDGRFNMSVGICVIRQTEHMKNFLSTHKLKYACAVRQYREWIENMNLELSLFLNYIVGLHDGKEDDPNIDKFEQWAIFDFDIFDDITTLETVL